MPNKMLAQVHTNGRRMLEGEFNRKLKKALDARLKRFGVVVFKHNDMTTGGIPDFTVSRGLKTIWIEVKMKGNKATALQADTLDRLKEGAFEVIAEKNGRFAEFKYLGANGKTICSFMSFDYLVETIASLVALA